MAKKLKGLEALANRQQNSDAPLTFSTAPSAMVEVNLAYVLIEDAFQHRQTFDDDLCEDYKTLWEQGVDLTKRDDIVVVKLTDRSGQLFYIDGAHRGMALAELRGQNALCRVRLIECTFNEAYIYSLPVNTQHGRPLNRAEKRALVHEMLENEQLRGYTDGALESLCEGMVSARTFSNVRAQMVEEELIPDVTERTTLDGRTIQTKAIGKKKVGPDPEPAPVVDPPDALVTATPTSTAPTIVIPRTPVEVRPLPPTPRTKIEGVTPLKASYTIELYQMDHGWMAVETGQQTTCTAATIAEAIEGVIE